MKKGRVFLGVAASLLGAVTLASCGNDGITTDLEDVPTVTSDVIKAQVEEDDYKVRDKGQPTVLTYEEDCTYQSVSGVNWCAIKTYTDRQVLYSLLTGKDICNIDDYYAVRRACTNGYFVSVITRVEPKTSEEEISYHYDVYDYLGNLVISYDDESPSYYTFTSASSTYYDNDDNSHSLYTLKLTKSDNSTVKLYYDYCYATKRVSYSTTNPTMYNLLKPGFEEVEEGLYVKTEELADGELLYLSTDSKDYEPIKLPNNVGEMYYLKDKLYYQTSTLLADDAKDYSYYVISPLNGETIKYELKSYVYDFTSSTLNEVELDYVIINEFYEKPDNEFTQIDFVKLEDGEFDILHNKMIGYVDSEGVIKYISNKDLELDYLIKLDTDCYYYPFEHELYDKELNLITQVSRRLNSDLFLDSEENRIYDKAGNIVKEFNNFSTVIDDLYTVINNIVQLDNVLYELKGSNLIEITDSELQLNGWIYKFTDLNPEDSTTAQYKVEARYAGTSISVTYYSNDKATLSAQTTIRDNALYSSSANIYADKEMTKRSIGILIK